MVGIDVSHNQGVIDWAKVKADTFQPTFAYIKATQGIGYTDPMVVTNANSAKGVGMQIGYYHFASLNSHNVLQDSADEANAFATEIAKLPHADLPPVLDVETNESKLSPAEVEKWISNFISVMATKGWGDIVIYSYGPFLDVNLPSTHTFGTKKLWLADYGKNLVLPKGWSKYWMWQYSQFGKISGVKTNIDLNKS